METYAVVIEITTYTNYTTDSINSKHLRKPPPPPKRKVCIISDKIIPDDTFVQIHLTDEDTDSDKEALEDEHAIKKPQVEKTSKSRWGKSWCCIL